MRGLLLAGPEGVICGGIAGFGDQREVEVLVKAGFTTIQAIQIAALNGARFLKSRIGWLAPGKQRRHRVRFEEADPSVKGQVGNR